MGVIKDIHDIIRTYLPKEVSLDIYMEIVPKKYLIHIKNTSGKSIHIKDININNKGINTISPIKGMEIDTNFPLHSNQQRTFTIFSSVDVERPKTIQFFIKRKFMGMKKKEYYI